MRKIFLLGLLCAFLSSMSSAPVFAQAELDRFKTEEEIAKENSEMDYFEVVMKQARGLWRQISTAVADLFSDGQKVVAEGMQDANVLDKAENAAKDYGKGAESRMKAIQEQTNLKGEVTNMEQVIEKKELHYETRDPAEVQAEMGK